MTHPGRHIPQPEHTITLQVAELKGQRYWTSACTVASEKGNNKQQSLPLSGAVVGRDSPSSNARQVRYRSVTRGGARRFWVHDGRTASWTPGAGLNKDRAGHSPHVVCRRLRRKPGEES